MVRKAPRFSALAPLVFAAWGCGVVRADDLPPAPVPVIVTTLPHPQEQPAPEPAEATGGLRTVSESPPAAPGVHLTGPPPCAPLEDANGPLLAAGPLVDRPCPVTPGWFAALDIGLVGPRLKNRLTAPVDVGPFTDQVQL